MRQYPSMRQYRRCFPERRRESLPTPVPVASPQGASSAFPFSPPTSRRIFTFLKASFPPLR